MNAKDLSVFMNRFYESISKLEVPSISINEAELIYDLLYEELARKQKVERDITENAMLIIDALRAYNPVVADNATSETCEWCGSDLQILAQAMAIDGAMKFATKQSNYCPNCGRHL